MTEEAALQSLPPFSVRGHTTFLVAPDGDGKSITVKQSPMMTKQAAAEYVGVGLNQFLELVRDESIRKRGTGHRPYHIDDLDDYLETL